MWWILACAAPVEPSEVFVAPDAPGPFDAVTWEDRFTDSAGVELTVQIWGPTTAARGTDGVQYDDLLQGEAWSQGELACESPRPVVMFSHGSQGIRWQSFFLTEAWAEHGLIVVAPDHPGNTFVDSSGDRAEIAAARPGQVIDSYDWLLAESHDAESKLFGCVDEAAGYLMSGHSFGAYTTLAVGGASLDIAGLREICETDDQFFCGAEHLFDEDKVDLSDPRAVAILPLAPGGAIAFGPHLADITGDAYVMGSTLDEKTPYETEAKVIYERLGGSPMLGTLIDGGHFSYTEMCVLPLSEFDGCTDEFLDIDVAKDLVEVTALAFTKRWLGWEEAEAWLPPDDALDLEWDQR
ncbi:MAG: hypothetical protein GY884_13455 [Proteobacteria bacterium]|nr:hypothetical protein [Pseudomonadota bacterium]